MRKVAVCLIVIVCVCLLWRGRAEARPPSMVVGEYGGTVTTAVDADPGGQDCGGFAFEDSTPLSLSIAKAGGGYTLTTRAPAVPLSVSLVWDGVRYTGTADVDGDETTVSLAVKGRRLTGAIYTQRRCSPVLKFAVKWRRKTPRGANTCSLDPSTCSGETICLNGACVMAFPRVYTFVLESATHPVRSPDGSTWDPNGGAPDPAAVVKLNGTKLTLLGTKATQTTTMPDTFDPVWDAAMEPVAVVAGSQLRVEVWDVDSTEHDWIVGCEWLLDADTLHRGRAECADGRGAIKIMFVTQ